MFRRSRWMMGLRRWDNTSAAWNVWNGRLLPETAAPEVHRPCWSELRHWLILARDSRLRAVQSQRRRGWKLRNDSSVMLGVDGLSTPELTTRRPGQGISRSAMAPQRCAPAEAEVLAGPSGKRRSSPGGRPRGRGKDTARRKASSPTGIMSCGC